jgi:hypothetical protein
MAQTRYRNVSTTARTDTHARKNQYPDSEIHARTLRRGPDRQVGTRGRRLYANPGVISTDVATYAAEEICAALFGSPDSPASRSGPPPRGTVLTAETAQGVAIEAEFVGMSDPAG